MNNLGNVRIFLLKFFRKVHKPEHIEEDGLGRECLSVDCGSFISSSKEQFKRTLVSLFISMCSIYG